MSADLHPGLDRIGHVAVQLIDPSAEAAFLQALSPFVAEASDRSGCFASPALLEVVAAALKDRLQALAPGHRLCGASLLPPTASLLAQVPSMCAADTAPALRVWLPLAPAPVHAQVLPGSHRYDNALRGPTLPNIWDGIAPTLAVQLQPLTLAPGMALLHDHALLHRLEVPGLALDLLPVGAELVHYFHDATQADAQRIDSYAVPDDFLCQVAAPGQRPAGGRHFATLRQDLSPVREQDYRALRMGILTAIYRPVQDANVVKTLPKTRPGLSKR
jgi:hypothetical protein